MENDLLEEALRLAGWLLAEQAERGARDEVPPPLVIFSADELERPKLVRATTKSDAYEDHVSAGRIFVKDQADRARCWVLAFEEDLDTAGRVILLELGWRGLGDPVSLGQRYQPPTAEGDNFRLLGEVELLGWELLPSAILDALESAAWREVVDEGAERHPVAGERWAAWSAERGEGPDRCSFKEFAFRVPLGWFTRPTESFPGLMLLRLLPWDLVGNEPSVTLTCFTMGEDLSVEGMVEHFKPDMAQDGVDVVSSDTFEVRSLSLTAGRLFWVDPESGMNTVKIFIRRGNKSFLGLWASALPEFWAETLRGLNAVLDSLEYEVDD